MVCVQCVLKVLFARMPEREGGRCGENISNYSISRHYHQHEKKWADLLVCVCVNRNVFSETKKKKSEKLHDRHISQEQ